MYSLPFYISIDFSLFVFFFSFLVCFLFVFSFIFFCVNNFSSFYTLGTMFIFSWGGGGENA